MSKYGRCPRCEELIHTVRIFSWEQYVSYASVGHLGFDWSEPESADGSSWAFVVECEECDGELLNTDNGADVREFLKYEFFVLDEYGETVDGKEEKD
jgi:hypothetical protein